MIKANLERFDSPVVMINQSYEDEDWGVATSYFSHQDALESEGEADLAQIGWHVSITMPNLDDLEFDQVFSAPESALDYGVKQILSGSLTQTASAAHGQESENNQLGHYHSIA